MRALGLIGLVLALLIVGVLAKRQMSAVTAVPVAPGVTAPQGATVRDTSQQVQQQVQQQVNNALDAAAKARKMPDDN